MLYFAISGREIFFHVKYQNTFAYFIYVINNIYKKSIKSFVELIKNVYWCVLKKKYFMQISLFSNAWKIKNIIIQISKFLTYHSFQQWIFDVSSEKKKLLHQQKSDIFKEMLIVTKIVS